MPLNINFRKTALLGDKIEQCMKPFLQFGKQRYWDPLDSWLLYFHYSVTVGLLLCLFLFIVGEWYVTSPMDCILKYDRSTVEDYQEDLCLSYPYILNGDERVYALHYRWVHWSLVILIAMYLTPLQLKNHFDVGFTYKFLESIASDGEDEDTRRMRIKGFIYGCLFHVNLYVDKFWILLTTLMLDTLAFLFLDIALQNRFIRLFPLDYPFDRWPQHFNDTISLAFPPFVECEIGIPMVLLNEMEEKIGCALNLNQIYDKVFILLWIWMVGLMFCTLVSIIWHLALMMLKPLKRNLIKGRKNRLKGEIETCLRNLCTGDLMLLNSLFKIVTAKEKEAVIKKVAEIIIHAEKYGYIPVIDELSQ